MRFDVVIIGGGIVGVALAARLAPHLKVALIEREPALGTMTTARSAAMFLPSYGGAAITPLTLASKAFLSEAPNASAPLLKPRHALHIGRQPHLTAFDQERAPDLALQALAPRQAVELFPILRESVIDGAWLETQAGDIDVAALLERFRRMALGAGAYLQVDAGEISPERSAGAWRIGSPSGLLEAPIIVNAAGAWADSLAARCGVAPLGLTPMRRTVVLGAAVAREGFESWPILKDVRERFYFRPYHGALLITPADASPSPPCDPAPDIADVARAVLRFETMCDHRLTRIERRWAGLRTFAPDQAPVVGWSAEIEGYFWLAGLGGFGVQTSPAVSLLAASQILGEAVPSTLTALGVIPERYAPARLAG
ncbi:FAD-binding oxidoreductase [Caulobacter segnis]|uniref:NAD(P)/FAD-dependent oxidoreductase n=1 Tax=Caulobacter segnis TaxID=88688 RepID=UPI002859C471|nr:FAD-binding oxidoreductase [Caulobacter segnis]MDR6623883.1 D-arginine dehydrogenase [Caulobacter segnis]